MDIEQAELDELRQELEWAIVDEIRRFEKATGRSVAELEVLTILNPKTGKTNAMHVNVNLFSD